MTGGGRLDKAVEWLGRQGFDGARLAVVLGSGLSPFLSGLDVRSSARFAEVPGFPVPAVGGHEGTIVSCMLGGRSALVLSGRVHHYEGRSPDEVTFAVRALCALGVPTLVLTNASGGVDPAFAVGDLLLIVDQVSLLSGRRGAAGRTFRMIDAFSPALRTLTREAAAARGIPLREGVYVGSVGPTYETPAEVAMARALGAGAVGMSTVSEAAAAAALGADVLGLSLITNIPLPGRFTTTTHDEVIEAGRAGAGRLLSLVAGVAERL
jgi:purine-nucleoside phosphorylase